MPNWCHNTLRITGDEAEVAAFVERARPTRDSLRESWESMFILPGETKPPFEEWADRVIAERPLSFEKHAPIGEWEYNNAVETWGCKWDASFSTSLPMFAIGGSDMNPELTKEAQGLVRAEGVSIYKFDTPWSPPVPWLETASGHHPELEFELIFGEAGNGYAGRARCVGGVLIEEEELAVEDVLTPEEMWF